MQAEAIKPASQGSETSDAELLDILYEILADDTGDDHGVSTETIEAFLHEHARAPEKAGSLSAFFEKHGLSKDPSDHGRDPALASVPSGVHHGMLPLSSAPSGVGAVPMQEAMPPMVGEVTSGRTAAAAQAAAGAAAGGGRPGWLMPALASLSLMLGLVGAVSAFVALQEQDLERELSLARLQQRATSEAVDALRAEARSLHEELDSQRASEQKLREDLATLQEAERLRQAQEAELRERRARRFGRPAARAGATGARGSQ